MPTSVLDSLSPRAAKSAQGFHRLLGVWPWEVLPQYPPASWAQTFLMKYCALAGEVSREPKLSLNDMVAELEKAVKARDSDVLKVCDIEKVRALFKEARKGHANSAPKDSSNGTPNGKPNGTVNGVETSHSPDQPRSQRPRRNIRRVNYVDPDPDGHNFTVDQPAATVEYRRGKRATRAAKQRKPLEAITATVNGKTTNGTANGITNGITNGTAEATSKKRPSPETASGLPTKRVRTRDDADGTPDSITVNVHSSQFRSMMRPFIKKMDDLGQSLKGEAKEINTELMYATQARVTAVENAKMAQKALQAAYLDIQDDVDELRTIGEEIIQYQTHVKHFHDTRSIMKQASAPLDQMEGLIESYSTKEEEMRKMFREKEAAMASKRDALELAVSRKREAVVVLKDCTKELREATRRLREGEQDQARGYNLVAMADIMRLGPDGFQVLREKFPQFISELRRLLE